MPGTWLPAQQLLLLGNWSFFQHWKWQNPRVLNHPCVSWPHGMIYGTYTSSTPHGCANCGPSQITTTVRHHLPRRGSNQSSSSCSCPYFSSSHFLFSSCSSPVFCFCFEGLMWLRLASNCRSSFPGLLWARIIGVHNCVWLLSLCLLFGSAHQRIMVLELIPSSCSKIRNMGSEFSPVPGSNFHSL